MEILYHYSHFLEILAGVYFGGFALLGFIQKGTTKNIYDKAEERRLESNEAKLLINEYFKVNVTSPDEGMLKYILTGFLWIIFSLIRRFITFCFLFGNNQAKKIGEQEKNEILLKKFFPSFFFAGCFCFMVILLSAFQSENHNEDCKRSVDFFILYYLLSSLLFQVWALVFFPFLVNKNNYLHLIILNVVFCAALTIISMVLALRSKLIAGFDWWFEEEHRMYLILFFIFTALFPLLYILFRFLMVLVAWEIPIFFNKVIGKVFTKSKQQIQVDINELTLSNSGESKDTPPDLGA